MNKPKVSIIIPVFNRENLILETLESVKNQSLIDWECIIVDDYSTDNSVELINTFILNDNRFNLISKKTEKKGAPSARNIGWKNAQAEFIVFLDSDDLLSPNSIEERVDHLNLNTKLDFNLSSNVEFKKDSRHKISRTLFLNENALEGFLSFCAVWQTSSPTWRKTFLQKLNGWDEDAESWQDGEFHIRALLLNPTFEWLSEKPNVFLRVQDSKSISSINKLSKFENNLFIFKKILKLLPHQYSNIFKHNVEIWIFNLIEKENYKNSCIFLNKNSFEVFKTSKLKLKIYSNIYHSTKKIKGLRGLVYLIRKNKNSFFSERKKFFIKNEISKEVFNQLKLELKDNSFFNEKILWLK